MKNIKSLVLMGLLSLVMVLSLVGCGNSAIVGKWKLTSGEASGIKLDMETLKQVMGTDVDIIFEFKGDGTFSGNFMGETAEGKWEEKNGKITLTAEGESLECALKDGKLIIESDGATLTFEK